MRELVGEDADQQRQVARHAARLHAELVQRRGIRARGAHVVEQRADLLLGARRGAAREHLREQRRQRRLPAGAAASPAEHETADRHRRHGMVLDHVDDEAVGEHLARGALGERPRRGMRRAASRGGECAAAAFARGHGAGARASRAGAQHARRDPPCPPPSARTTRRSHDRARDRPPPPARTSSAVTALIAVHIAQEPLPVGRGHGLAEVRGEVVASRRALRPGRHLDLLLRAPAPRRRVTPLSTIRRSAALIAASTSACVLPGAFVHDEEGDRDRAA